ncbi:MAG: hypothetical protein KDA05_07285 [Phycisphaerales bacterium]|nr:hypothetical protein [Phycisphaerales bacterium]
MGLEERRKIKELQDTNIPARTKELGEICGSPVGYDIQWDSFASDAEALKFLDNVACHRVNMAMRQICTDDLAKEAIRDSLKTIRISNVAEEGQRGMTFGGGVLDMKFSYAKGLSGACSDRDIAKTLMAGL